MMSGELANKSSQMAFNEPMSMAWDLQTLQYKNILKC